MQSMSNNMSINMFNMSNNMSNMQFRANTLLDVTNMQNMQKKYAQYAQYAIMISICRICTPHFADGYLSRQYHSNSDIIITDITVTPILLRAGGLLAPTLRLKGGSPPCPGFLNSFLNSDIIAGRGPARTDAQAEGWQPPVPWIPQLVSSSMA